MKRILFKHLKSLCKHHNKGNCYNRNHPDYKEIVTDKTMSRCLAKKCPEWGKMK